MPRLNVSRSITIDRPRASIADNIVQFQRWPAWSPWLCQEPEAQVTYEGAAGDIGSGYAWEGERVGAGHMHLASRTDDRIDCDLSFLKPWKSQAKVSFDLESSGDEQTRVTWSMQSSLPFFMFFMRRTFESYVGMDYERGLRMLKEHEESGKVNSYSRLNEGTTPLPGCYYVGQSGSSSLTDLGSTMNAAFPALEHQIATAGFEQDGPAFCHYTLMDPVRDQWEYTMGIPVIAKTESDLIKHRPEFASCLLVQHTGSYAHLGNAWATVFGALKNRRKKHDKANGGLEVYQTAPSNDGTVATVTDVYLPLR